MLIYFYTIVYNQARIISYYMHMENKQVATLQTAKLSQYDPAVLATIKNTVALHATDHELELFLTLAGTYKLDPFAREIFFIKGDGPKASPTIVTSRDGYLAIAQRTGEFEGLMSAVVHKCDEFKPDFVKGEPNHVPNMTERTRANIAGAWAICYRKGYMPAMVYVSYEEYKKSSPTWNSYPSAMIEKVAEVRAIKRLFAVSGLVSQEEIGEHSEPTGSQEYGNTVEKPRRAPAKAKAPAATAQKDEGIIEGEVADTPAADERLETFRNVVLEELTAITMEMCEVKKQPVQEDKIPAIINTIAKRELNKGYMELDEKELKELMMIARKRLYEAKNPPVEAPSAPVEELATKTAEEPTDVSEAQKNADATAEKVNEVAEMFGGTVVS